MAILKITRVIGKNIRRYRKDKKITQIELAEFVKMEKETISRIELGKYNVSLRSLESFAEALHVPLLELVREQPLHIQTQAEYIAEILQDVEDSEREVILRMMADAVYLCKKSK